MSSFIGPTLLVVGAIILVVVFLVSRAKHDTRTDRAKDLDDISKIKGTDKK